MFYFVGTNVFIVSYSDVLVPACHFVSPSVERLFYYHLGKKNHINKTHSFHVESTRGPARGRGLSFSLVLVDVEKKGRLSQLNVNMEIINQLMAEATDLMDRRRRTLTFLFLLKMWETSSMKQYIFWNWEVKSVAAVQNLHWGRSLSNIQVHK